MLVFVKFRTLYMIGGCNSANKIVSREDCALIFMIVSCDS